jgi:hypothetical protein
VLFPDRQAISLKNMHFWPLDLGGIGRSVVIIWTDQALNSSHIPEEVFECPKS